MMRPSTLFRSLQRPCFHSHILPYRNPAFHITSSPRNLQRTLSPLAQQTSPFSTTAPRLKRKKPAARKDRRITLIRYHLYHPLTPRPLRLSRLRALRHWTIHRAYQLYQRQQRQARERELERFYNSMRDACEALRVLPVGDGKHGPQGNLYRRAMHKRGVWTGWPIEASRAQTEWPAIEGWNRDWKR